MLNLRAPDSDVVLTPEQETKIKFWLLESLPATSCIVGPGPGISTRVPNRSVEDLAPGVRRKIEEIIGCALEVTDDDGRTPPSN